MDDLVLALRAPEAADWHDVDRWNAVISVARGEMLLGTLAARVSTQTESELSDELQAFFTAVRAADAQAQRLALWEAEMARRALSALHIPVVLLKGTAFAAAGLSAAEGRQIGDLDILVPEAALAAVEEALIKADWEWVKKDAYDAGYYRDHMHELPPMIHATRDRMIDVHHTILPRTHRITPDAVALIADATPLGERFAGLSVLAPADMVCHAAAHLFADGDLSGGLRNLWDIDRLLRQFAETELDLWGALEARAGLHGLSVAVARALRLSHQLFATPVPENRQQPAYHDAIFRRRLLARNAWGREMRPVTRFGFYVRSHWMRMPPFMLARHLLTKTRKTQV